MCEHLDKVERLAALLVEKLPAASIETFVAPALGGLVIGQEVARQIGARFLFAEKEQDRLVLRRGFTLRAGERVMVVEDVITRGGRVQETLDIVRGYGGEPGRAGGPQRRESAVWPSPDLPYGTHVSDLQVRRNTR